MQLSLAWGFLRNLALSTLGHFRAKASLYFAPSAKTADPLVLFQVAIELVSGTARLFSLSFRLFANIMAGHSILQLVSFMACSGVSTMTLAVHCVQSTMLLVTWAMEAGLALLQAYVFGALLLIYAGETHPCCGNRSSPGFTDGRAHSIVAHGAELGASWRKSPRVLSKMHVEGLQVFFGGCAENFCGAAASLLNSAAR